MNQKQIEKVKADLLTKATYMAGAVVDDQFDGVLKKLRHASLESQDNNAGIVLGIEVRVSYKAGKFGCGAKLKSKPSEVPLTCEMPVEFIDPNQLELGFGVETEQGTEE